MKKQLDGDREFIRVEIAKLQATLDGREVRVYLTRRQIGGIREPIILLFHNALLTL